MIRSSQSNVIGDQLHIEENYIKFGKSRIVETGNLPEDIHIFSNSID